VKSEFEGYSTIEDIFLYLIATEYTPEVKDLLPVSLHKGYVFSIVPLSPLSGEVLTMVYTKDNIDTGIVEFDISTKNRTDKYYFIIMAPNNSSISDNAIAKLESSKT
jgi:hypothetical protein